MIRAQRSILVRNVVRVGMTLIDIKLLGMVNGEKQQMAMEERQVFTFRLFIRLGHH